MISVCIPVYNYDIRPLAVQLSEEAGKAAFEPEIIFLDDGSDIHYRTLNSQVSAIPKVRYLELEVNRGRSAVRNILGREANHPWLLFLDCDSGLPSGGFLRRYLDAAKEADEIGRAHV